MGRSVLHGDSVRDLDFNLGGALWELVQCSYLLTPPCTRRYGSIPGYRVKTGDANGTYTQSSLRGAKTWATLPDFGGRNIG